MKMQHQSIIRSYLTLSAAMLAWGLSFIFTKLALESLTVYSLVFFRFSLTAVIFIGWFIKRGFPRLSLKDHFQLLIIGLFQPWLYFTFETHGLVLTTASKTALIIATIPVVVLVLSVVFLKERAGLFQVIGILLSILGITILIGGDPDTRFQLNRVMTGDFLIFGAVLAAAVYTVLIRNVGQRLSTVDITGIQIIWGAILFLPEFLWELPTIDFSRITPIAVLSVVGLSLFATIGAFLCYNYALSRIEAVKASIFLNGIPVVTAISAWWILGERLTGLQMIGGIVILAAVYLANAQKTPTVARTASSVEPS